MRWCSSVCARVTATATILRCVWRSRRACSTSLADGEASFGSPLGASRIQFGMQILPDAAEAEALAASITFLLSDDGVNVNGVVLASDNGWSAA